jgi:hypothetical protein
MHHDNRSVSYSYIIISFDHHHHHHHIGREQKEIQQQQALAWKKNQRKLGAVS